jgi:ribonucleotide monophosphatase NagD (HAD superfamily)
VRYDDLRRAAVAVQRGAAFIASNPDTSYPAPDGTRWPGAGALAAAVTATTGVEPTVIGKPNGPILLAALARAGGGDPLLIGDRLDTDVEGARRLGWPSMLVLTGISTRDDVRAAGSSPTYVVDDLGALFD